jgi:PII-like signaling protein
MDGTPGGPPTKELGSHEGFERMQQLTIYIKETDHVERRPLYLQILELVRSSGGAGATVLKGIAGYSASSRSIQTAGFADVQQHLPLVIVIVDMAWRVEALLPQFENLIRLNGGLITVQDLEGHSYLHPNVHEGGHKDGKGHIGGADA